MLPGAGAAAGEAFFRRQFGLGVVCALAGASLWGFSGACAQFLLNGYGMDPSLLTAVRMLGAGAVFIVVLAVGQRKTLSSMLSERRTLRQLAAFGIALYLSQVTYTIVIGYTNAGTATVLQMTGTVFVLLYASAKARSLPRLREAAGVAVALAATWLIATQGDPGALSLPLPGLLWGLANGLAVAFYLVYPRRLFDRWGSFASTGVGMLAGGVAACAACAVLRLGGAQPALPVLDGAGCAVLAVFVLVGTFAAFALYLHGVSVVGSVRGGLLGAVEPVSATVVSALWLGTAFTGADVAGMALMIAMVFLVTNEKPQPHDKGTHDKGDKGTGTLSCCRETEADRSAPDGAEGEA